VDTGIKRSASVAESDLGGSGVGFWAGSGGSTILIGTRRRLGFVSGDIGVAKDRVCFADCF